MSRWTFWEWVAYAVLFVAALIVAADQGIKLSPSLMEKASGIILSSYWAFAPLVFVLLATAILIASQLGWLGSRLARSAELHLRYYGDERPPTIVSHVDVWRWYSLRNAMAVMTAQGVMSASITIIFITFDQPVLAGTLEVRSADFVVPKHEVKEFNNRFAIIAINDPPPGVLDILIINR